MEGPGGAGDVWGTDDTGGMVTSGLYRLVEGAAWLPYGKDWHFLCSGVVPAISGIIRKLTTPAEQVLLLTPVYDSLLLPLWIMAVRVLESPLKYDGERYRADFQDLERKLADPQTTLMILCNPA